MARYSGSKSASASPKGSPHVSPDRELADAFKESSLERQLTPERPVADRDPSFPLPSVESPSSVRGFTLSPGTSRFVTPDPLDGRWSAQPTITPRPRAGTTASVASFHDTEHIQATGAVPKPFTSMKPSYLPILIKNPYNEDEIMAFFMAKRDLPDNRISNNVKWVCQLADEDA
jgi:hypothetical protein